MDQNAVTFKKDILADVVPAAAGISEIVDLRCCIYSNGFAGAGRADRFSCQAVYDVQAPSAKTFDSGGVEIDTFTFDTLANTDPGDYMVVYDTTGLAWAAAADVTGTDPEPTGAVWVAIPAAQKVQVDLSGAVSAADVAEAFSDALTALADVPFTSVDTVAAVACTQTIRGVVDAPEVHNEDDSGAGSISVVVTDAGVNSEVNVDDNEISIPSHGFPVGFAVRLTTTGTLPAPFLVLTDYYVIVVDANTVQFAATLADALAGTALVLVDQGSDEAVNTVTGLALSDATVTFQKSNDAVNWVNIQSPTSITMDGTVMIEQVDVSYQYFRVVKGLVSGVLDTKALTLVIGSAM